MVALFVNTTVQTGYWLSARNDRLDFIHVLITQRYLCCGSPLRVYWFLVRIADMPLIGSECLFGPRSSWSRLATRSSIENVSKASLLHTWSATIS